MDLKEAGLFGDLFDFTIGIMYIICILLVFPEKGDYVAQLCNAKYLIALNPGCLK